MEKVLLSVLSVLLGFALSQAVNLISFIRRPRFRIKNWSDGVSSVYTGDPPETPWEIELGFYLENFGRNSAKNTRIFVSDLRVSKEIGCSLELTSIDLMELERPIDIIPPKERVAVRLGTIRSDNCVLELYLHTNVGEDQSSRFHADTRGNVRFSAKFYVSCDDKNSFKVFTLDFRPDQNEWASSFLEDYSEEQLMSLTRPPK